MHGGYVYLSTWEAMVGRAHEFEDSLGYRESLMPASKGRRRKRRRERGSDRGLHTEAFRNQTFTNRSIPNQGTFSKGTLANWGFPNKTITNGVFVNSISTNKDLHKQRPLKIWTSTNCGFH